MMNKIRRKRQRAALMLITAAGIMLSLAGIAGYHLDKDTTPIPR